MKQYTIDLIFNMFLAAKKSMEAYPDEPIKWQEFLPKEVLKKYSSTVSNIKLMFYYLKIEVKIAFADCINSFKYGSHLEGLGNYVVEYFESELKYIQLPRLRKYQILFAKSQEKGFVPKDALYKHSKPSKKERFIPQVLKKTIKKKQPNDLSTQTSSLTSKHNLILYLTIYLGSVKKKIKQKKYGGVFNNQIETHQMNEYFQIETDVDNYQKSAELNIHPLNKIQFVYFVADKKTDTFVVN
jgi:hypothetical protein